MSMNLSLASDDVGKMMTKKEVKFSLLDNHQSTTVGLEAIGYLLLLGKIWEISWYQSYNPATKST